MVFSHFPHYPQSNWAPLVLTPGCVGLYTFLAPMGLSNNLSCEAGSFSHCHLNPTDVFSQRFWGFISPHFNPGLHALSHSPVVPPSLSERECGTAQSTSCPSPSRLPVWMNVSSLSPLLSDFHIVRFSGSSGCVLLLNLLLSFFWLCEETQCVYQCLHLGQKFTQHCFEY